MTMTTAPTYPLHSPRPTVASMDTRRLRRLYDHLTDLGDDAMAEAVADLVVQVETGAMTEAAANRVLDRLR